MSFNLIELLRAGEDEAPATALSVLKEAMDERGEIGDEDRRRAAALSGLPEAAVYGVSTFYDDLLEPRGSRHLSVCTGTACWAADFGGHVAELRERTGLDLGERSEDGSLSLGQTVCLGFCHTAAALRDGATVDAGAGSVKRAAVGSCRAAPEPEPGSMLDEPVLLVPGDWAGLHSALDSMTPEELLEQVKAANLRGRGGAGFPAGTKWEFARGAAGEDNAIVVNGDEGDPGSYIDKHLMERSPDLLLEGMALAGYAVGAARGFVFVRSEYPRSLPVLREAVDRARAEGRLGDDVLGSGFGFDVEVLEGAGSYVVGEETALLASLQGLRGTVSARPPFPAEKGWHGKPTVVNNVETLCNVPFIAREGSEAYAALSPGATPGTKLVCLNERFRRPGVYEVRFGTPLSQICDQLGGGLVDEHEIKALQIGGPLGGILPGWKLDTPFDFDQLAAEGCMVGHGSVLAFDERTDMRALAHHLLEFGAHESCGKCFPCRIGLQRAVEMVERPGSVDRARLEALLETLELGSLCAHGGGMPAPIRSLIAHFPDELGLSGPEQPGTHGEPEPKGPDDPFMRRPAEPTEDGGRADW
jgi:NADH:ubiquinone oxidoreductase subunit F (NADH-binding)/NADH:ubiquinone oxidoreductase subunit E